MNCWAGLDRCGRELEAKRHPCFKHTLYSLTLAPSLKVDPNLSGRGMLDLIQMPSRFVLWAAEESNG